MPLVPPVITTRLPSYCPMVAFSLVRPKSRLASDSRVARNCALCLPDLEPFGAIIGADGHARRDRSAGTATQDLGHHVQFSRGRVFAQDTALEGAAAEEKSTPETLTTACHAASWLARS